MVALHGSRKTDRFNPRPTHERLNKLVAVVVAMHRSQRACRFNGRYVRGSQRDSCGFIASYTWTPPKLAVWLVAINGVPTDLPR